MPKFRDDETLDQHKLAGTNYGYTATRPDHLTATEYTLVSVVFDESGSTFPFKNQMEKVLKEVVKACRRSPRADNLMLRVLNFGTNLREVHGFKPLGDCNEADYDGCYQSGGSTALFDASHNGVAAIRQYGKQLSDNDFMANGINIVITDGDNNEGSLGIPEVLAEHQACIQSESLESLVSILIGVNTAGTAGDGTPLKDYLEKYHKEGGFTQFVPIDQANEKSLAKLADFVSKSISSQSQALGTGGPSKSLTF